ncbi:MAG: hypothetical protein Q9M43_07115 [Sulfurimonas sp.]|nr:hypothetical protein [Sulfurimonas sp.]
MDDFKVTETVGTDGVKIVVVGGGSNMVDNLIDSAIADKVKLLAINT